MTHHSPQDHFRGKSVAEHLRDARAKGVQTAAETHGTEMPGHLAAGADSAKNTSVSLFILWIILSQFHLPFLKAFSLLLIFALGWLIWMIGRSASLGWARLERLHRLIEEERWEIEHHRKREREELVEMYRQKGFEGKLLDDVVEVLMADDNRLLRVMVEEELGLSLEAYEHPLKQGMGAALGAFITIFVALIGFYLFPTFGLPLFTGLIFLIGSYASARVEKNKLIQAVVWSLSVALLASGIVYFLTKLLLK